MDPTTFWFAVFIVLALMLAVFWVRSFVALMLMEEGTFKGAYDKLIFGLLFIVLPPLAPFALSAWIAARDREAATARQIERQQRGISPSVQEKE